jgi:hypothetical protein
MDAETHRFPGEKEEGFLMGIRRLGGSGLHTTRSIAQTFLKVALNVASVFKDFLRKI